MGIFMTDTAFIIHIFISSVLKKHLLSSYELQRLGKLFLEE